MDDDLGGDRVGETKVVGGSHAIDQDTNLIAAGDCLNHLAGNRLSVAELAGCMLLGIKSPALDAGKGGVLFAIGDVHHHDMGMQVGIEFAAGMLGELLLPTG